MGLVSPEDRRSKGDTRPMTQGIIQLGRADVREDKTFAMVLSFLSHTSIFSQSRARLENCILESKLLIMPRLVIVTYDL